MFLELNQLAQEDLAANGDEQNNDNIDNNSNDFKEDVVNRADAELLLYKREHQLLLLKDGGSYSNPLDWWYLKQQQYSLMATRVLAIPATSAPSGVFSTAGITIAKERSRLDPHNAGELLFLHDALPAIKKYEASQ
jgi:hypothetical protein